MPTTQPLPPGSTIGIIGGGQLGRMAALAAARLGYRVHIFCPEADSPAEQVAAAATVADYTDLATLEAFARAVDVVTFEFENIPAESVRVLSALVPVRPGWRVLEVAQDRISEKSFFNSIGIETAPWAPVNSAEDLKQAIAKLGRPAVLKTTRFGYDGKGQAMIRPETDPSAAWETVGRAPSILEGFVPFEREVSVVAARTASGEFAAYDLCANEHRNHILDTTRVPAGVASMTESRAIGIARTIADALDYVGILAVEMFLVTGGGGERLVVNEMAPRVHNSGHWTIEGALTSQFENHVRAICGLPLGDTATLFPRIEMSNLIGDAAQEAAEVLADPRAHLHFYGKADARKGRKMGHVTRLG